jgi:PAS domain S-box-containing protein
VDADTNAVLFNAVPLLLLAALSLTAAGLRVRASRRQGLLLTDLPAALLAGTGLAAALLGVALLVEREPLAGRVWLGLVAILVAAAPVALLLTRKPAEPAVPAPAAGAGERLATGLAEVLDVEELGRRVADAALERFDLDLVELVLLDEDARTGQVVAAREAGRDVEWLRGLHLDLEGEPTGISAVVDDLVPLAVFDAPASGAISRRLTERAGMKSCAFVPVLADTDTIGVLVVATRSPRVFSAEQLAQLQSFVAEAAPALARASTAHARLASAREAALLRATQELSADLGLDQRLSQLAAELRDLLGAEAVDFWTLVPGSGELECVGSAGGTGAVPGSRAAPGGQSASGGTVESAIVSLGRPRGVVRAHLREPRRLSPSDRWLLDGFASLVAVALQSADAAELTSEQANTERGFYRVASVLSEPLSSEATLDAVAQAASESLGGAAAALLRPAGGQLELAAWYELPEELRRALGGEPEDELTAAARSGKLLASKDFARETRFGKALSAAAAAAGFRSLLAVPLAQPRVEANGLVLVFFEEEHTFRDDELELAGHVAGAASGALERSELYELERRSRALAQRLAGGGRELASELDPENVLDLASRLAVELLDAAAASVWVLEGDELVLHAAHGPGAAAGLEARRPSTTWLLGDIVQSRAERTIADARRDARAAETDPLLEAGLVSYLGVPMLAPDGSVQGVLSAYDARPRDWRDEEGEALEALAAAAAAARANAEHYQGVRHEQQRSEAILENVADGIVAVDRDGRVVLWNPAAEHITGVAGAEALGRTPVQVLGRSLGSEGAHDSPRLVAIRRGSEEAWLSLSEAVMTDPAGAVAGRIYAFRDISSERAVEQMKSDFVSTVSHELRTPLTSIYGFAETLLRQDVLFGEPERETFLRYIASESERLTAIVDRLLSVAQLDTGAMSVQLAAVDVASVVSEVVQSLEATLGGNGHRFVVSIPDEPLPAEADRDKLGQVLSHLVDNAVRYSPAGGTVTVGARRADSGVEVRVEDEGLGIPRAEQERIFRKFYRGESGMRTVGAGATGLGLFLAEGLVTAMGGRIWVDSDEGRGATFVVELPAARD